MHAPRVLARELAFTTLVAGCGSDAAEAPTSDLGDTRLVVGADSFANFAGSPTGRQWIANRYDLHEPGNDQKAPRLGLVDYDPEKNEAAVNRAFPSAARWRRGAGSSRRAG